ncbi:MAG: ATP-dependent Clp protease proteolytic subunit [Clostridia bacterium]|nr:ATP-dependent Clp protease proteolytic subunit [Clostridia bacterium]
MSDREKIEENNELDKEKAENLRLENVQMSNAVTTESDGKRLYCMTIIGQIEGHYLLPTEQKATKYEQMIPLLVSIEESDDIDGLLIVLNTVGGDVEAGLAISEMIASMKKPTVSLVLGGGHSIGVPLAVSAKKSFIVPSATMTVHPVRTTGLVVSAPQTYNYFNRMQDRILTFVCEHSRVEKSTLSEMMLAKDELATDMGTVLEGKEAVECGLIDEVGGLNDAINSLRQMITETCPEEQKEKSV